MIPCTTVLSESGHECNLCRLNYNSTKIYAAVKGRCFIHFKKTPACIWTLSIDFTPRAPDHHPCILWLCRKVTNPKGSISMWQMHIVSSETEKNRCEATISHDTHMGHMLWDYREHCLWGWTEKCQRRASMWQTLPGYQNSQALQTPVKGLILIPLLPDIFNTTETYRVTHSKMLITLRKNGKIWAKHTKKEKKVLFPFTLWFLYHTSS